jgi:hypothetical protein
MALINLMSHSDGNPANKTLKKEARAKGVGVLLVWFCSHMLKAALIINTTRPDS